MSESSAALKIPPEEQAICADECAGLWRMSRDYWLRTIACLPGFPRPIAKGTWIVGEVLAFRREHRR